MKKETKIFHKFYHKEEYKDNQEQAKYYQNIKIRKLNLMIQMQVIKNLFIQEWQSIIHKYIMTSNYNKHLHIKNNKKKLINHLNLKNLKKKNKKKVSKLLNNHINFKVQLIWVVILIKKFYQALLLVHHGQNLEIMKFYMNRTRKINKKIRLNLALINTESNR